MDFEIHVDRHRCMGSGQCVHWAPGAFTQDDEGISVVVDPHGEPESRIVTAVTSCPVEAISLRVGGTIVEAGLLRNWHHGSLGDEPVVSLIERLADDHEALRTTLRGIHEEGAAAGGTGTRVLSDSELVTDFVDALAAHQSLEAGTAYPVIVDLVGHPLVEAFDHDHTLIRQAVQRFAELTADGMADATADGMADATADGIDGAEALSSLARLLEDHIRLEEALLFPVALGALVRRASSGERAG